MRDVEFFKDGAHMGISTTCQNENEFIQKVAEGLGKMEQNGDFNSDWEFQLVYWLPQIVDICMKYRGLKVERVGEIRQYYTGDLRGPAVDVRFSQEEATQEDLS